MDQNEIAETTDELVELGAVSEDTRGTPWGHLAEPGPGRRLP